MDRPIFASIVPSRVDDFLAMADSAAKTTVLVQLLERMQGGDREARDELVRAFHTRLDHLARTMLRKYPGVGRWVEVEDILQASLLRLLRALESVRPDSTRAFFGLAAEQMRRELLDLGRRFYGPQGIGANHASVGDDPGAIRPAFDPPDPDNDNSDLDKWCQFHTEVAKLPVQEREVVGLIYYHGWTQAQVAEMFEVNVRTVRRWWEAALVTLHRELEDKKDEDSRS
jgi:RNA polymerase sigma factor (sigma-70 family)